VCNGIIGRTFSIFESLLLLFQNFFTVFIQNGILQKCCLPLKRCKAVIILFVHDLIISITDRQSILIDRDSFFVRLITDTEHIFEDLPVFKSMHDIRTFIFCHSKRNVKIFHGFRNYTVIKLCCVDICCQRAVIQGGRQFHPVKSIFRKLCILHIFYGTVQ